MIRREREIEAGQTLLSMLVALALFAMILGVLAIVTRSWMIQTNFLKREVALLDSVIATEDLLRKEFETLLFAPYCPSLLPSYSSMYLGQSVDARYRRDLQQNIWISTPPATQSAKPLNLYKLQGRGSSHYSPEPVKKLQRLVEGSALFYLVGLKETGLWLREEKIVGDLSASLIGIRNAYFYMTDCRNSILLLADRKDDGFVMGEQDLSIVKHHFDLSRLQIYLLQEYLVYLQIREQESFLVVDYMDGQAFYRAPYIVDLNITFEEGELTVLLVSAIAREAKAIDTIMGEYQRIIENGWAIQAWPIVISLE